MICPAIQEGLPALAPLIGKGTRMPVTLGASVRPVQCCMGSYWSKGPPGLPCVPREARPKAPRSHQGAADLIHHVEVTAAERHTVALPDQPATAPT